MARRDRQPTTDGISTEMAPWVRPRRPWGRAWLVSGLLHALCLLWLVGWWQEHVAKGQTEPSPVAVMVELVPMVAVQPPSQVKEPPKPVLRPLPPRSVAVRPKPALRPVQHTPKARPAPAVVAASAEVMPPLSAQGELSEADEATDAAHPHAGDVQPEGAKAVKPVAAAVGSAQGREHYYARLRHWLERHKHYPVRARAMRQEGVVQLQFTLNRGGDVQSHRLMRSSGHALLDKAALQALADASPLPAIPDALGVTELTVTVPFGFRLR